MTEVLVEFDTVLRREGGDTWSARAVTQERPDGLWEGRLEFTPRNADGDPVSTGRETEQSHRDGVLYWAEGLTQVYLEGALVRALAKPMRERKEAEGVNLED